MTPNSPSAVSTYDKSWIFYLAQAPANASKSVTATVTGASATDAWAAEFVGVAASSPLENDVGRSSAGTGTNINDPGLTTTNDGDLLIGVSGTGAGMIISADAPFTGVDSIINGDWMEYAVQAVAGAQTIRFTQNPASGWTGMIAAFKSAVGPAAKLAFAVNPTNAVAGASIAPAVQVTVEDALGSTVTTSTASIILAIGANPGGSTLSGTNPKSAVAGVATFSNLALDRVGTNYTLTAASGGLTGASSINFDITVGAPSKLAFTVQPSNTTVGVGIAPAMQVAVQDSQGNTVTSSTANITVAIGTNPGSGTLSGTVTQSAVAGVATFAGLSLNKTGVGYTLTASSGGLTGASSGGFNIVPGAANKLAFTTQPATASAGAAIAPTVSVQDIFGNTVTVSAASITLAIGNNPGGGILSGTNPTSVVLGVASFGDLSVDKVGTGYTLTASSGGLTGATSVSFDVNPGAATQLAFTVQPSTATAGATIAPALQVTVEDAFGNPVTTSTAGITLDFSNNPGGGVLSGTNPKSAVAGVATFSNLAIDKAASGYVLSASAPGLTGDASASFDINAGPAAKLAFTVAPSSTTAGSSISPAVQTTVQDSLGNTIASSTASIALSIGANPAGGTLSGTVTQVAVAGVATFTNLSLNKTGVGYTLTAASGGLTGATSAGFDIFTGAAAKLAFSVQPASATAGTAIAPSIAVQDSSGNTVTSSNVSIGLAIGANPGGGILSGTNPVSAAAGVASFADLSIDRAGVGYTLRASAAGMADITSARFDITFPEKKTYVLGCDCQSPGGTGFGLWGLLALTALARRLRPPARGP